MISQAPLHGYPVTATRAADPSGDNVSCVSINAGLYYIGVSGFSPAVHFTNYGFPRGQVRSNMFAQAPTWELREWRTGLNASAQPVFVVDTVKQNPFVEFYHEGSSSAPLFVSEQSAFLSDFTSAQLPILASTNVPFSISARCDRVNSAASNFSNRFNDFGSISIEPSDEPRVRASTAFKNAVTAARGSITLTTDELLNRAGTQACAGCHMFSVNEAIGGGQTWPDVAPGGFVHVREQDNGSGAPVAIAALSQALNDCFLPLRKRILETFVCNGGPSPTDAGVADTGIVDSGIVDAGAPDVGVADSGIVSCNTYQTCPSGQFCDFSGNNVCGSTGNGICQPRPASCSYGSTVCGCDGVTYSNECLAHQAGTDVAASGTCGGGGGGGGGGGCMTGDISSLVFECPVAPEELTASEIFALQQSFDSSILDSARSRLLEARTPEAARDLLRRLNVGIEVIREAERKQPGAFFEHRPVH